MSDIFNEYAKIMEDQGLLKNAQRSSEAKTRPQGIDPEAIQMLYHVKPNGKDEKPIVEQAHPEPAYVAPAYDRMNGLVENVQERQNMMIEIMEDPQHGKLTQHRYVKANNELLQELIRVATYMDNKNQEDLMKLADSCAQNLTDIKKEAFLPAIGWLAAAKAAGWIAAGLGAYTTLSNNLNLSAGLINDADALVSESKDVLSPEWYVVEDEGISAQVSRQVSQLVSLASKIKAKALEAHKMRHALTKTLSKVNDSVEQDTQVSDKSAEKLVTNDYHEILIKFFNEYQEKVSSFLEEVSVIKTNLKRSVDLHQGAGGFMGLLTELKRQVLPTHLQDVVMMAERLQKSLSEELAAVSDDLMALEGLKEANDETQKVAVEMTDQDADLPDVELSSLLETNVSD